MNSNRVVRHEIGSQDTDSRKSAEVRISGDELGSVCLRDGVNHCVGHREAVHNAYLGGRSREFEIQRNLYGAKRVRDESLECRFIVGHQQLFVNFINYDCRYEKPVTSSQVFSERVSLGAVADVFNPARRIHKAEIRIGRCGHGQTFPNEFLWRSHATH